MTLLGVVVRSALIKTIYTTSVLRTLHVGAVVVHLRPSHVSYLDIPTPPPLPDTPFLQLFPMSIVDRLKHRRKSIIPAELEGKS